MIDSFKGKYKFLSNFVSVKIELKGETYGSVEHAYQAMKSPEDKSWIQYCSDPYVSASEVKKVSKYVKMRPDWEEVKPKVMLWCLRRKFSQEPFKSQLLSTGDKILIEGNYWHDNYWGNCTCEKCKEYEGRNVLGKMLMKVREEIR